MREILFRGKRVDNGEWNYGVPIVNTDCVPPKYMMLVCVIGGGLGIEYKEVIPETVGQFTGLKDCNGKMIFEGDVVKVRGSKKVGEYTTTVVFKRNCFTLDDNKTIFTDNMSLIGVEIIGNVHDNPESLGGK